MITFDEFTKVEILVVTIKHAEKVENSTKLLKLVCDDGSGVDRTILTGMQQYYEPSDFVGLQTLIVANLEPRKMMGIESQGMLLSVGTDLSKKPILITLNSPAENGQLVG